MQWGFYLGDHGDFAAGAVDWRSEKSARERVSFLRVIRVLERPVFGVTTAKTGSKFVPGTVLAAIKSSCR